MLTQRVFIQNRLQFSYSSTCSPGFGTPKQSLQETIILSNQGSCRRKRNSAINNILLLCCIHWTVFKLITYQTISHLSYLLSSSMIFSIFFYYMLQKWLIPLAGGISFNYSWRPLALMLKRKVFFQMSQVNTGVNGSYRHFHSRQSWSQESPLKQSKRLPPLLFINVWGGSLLLE